MSRRSWEKIFVQQERPSIPSKAKSYRWGFLRNLGTVELMKQLQGEMIRWGKLLLTGI